MLLSVQSQLFQLVYARCAAAQVPKSRFASKLFRASCKFLENLVAWTPDSLWVGIIAMEYAIKYSNQFTFRLFRRVAGWTRFELKLLHTAFSDPQFAAH
jgi:hypothetical protein